MDPKEATNLKPLARRFFDVCDMECELDNALLRALGADPEAPGNWPCGDIGYDSYDGSFELWGTRDEFMPTDAQLDAIWALGFARGWICYRDGTEIYVSATARGERKASHHDPKAEAKRQERQHRRHLAAIAAQKVGN